MPLPPSEDRTLFHTRTVTCKGYKRTDGLWDIEGHMTDIKPHDMPSPEQDGSIIQADEPLHDMWLRITVDMDLVIHDAVAVMDHTPFSTCPEIANAYTKLIGLQIKGGFTKQVKTLLGGTQGCTHLVELLGPIATTAFQTTHQERKKTQDWGEGQPVPGIMDTCHSWSRSGPVVKRLWPHFAKDSGQQVSKPVKKEVIRFSNDDE
jgi:hypothetical protein